MTALAANLARDNKGQSLLVKQYYLVEDNFHLYQGSLVMINAAGYARPAAAVASNKGCVGIAETEVDNTLVGHTQGGKSVVVEEGIFRFATSATPAQGDLLMDCYSEDDNTIHKLQASNEPFAGMLMRRISTTAGDLRVSATLTRGVLG